jgi:hypothetical protein
MAAQNLAKWLDLLLFDTPGAKPAPGSIRLFTIDGESLEAIDSDGNSVFSGGGGVPSVFGRTGAIIAEAGDYDVAEITGAASETFVNDQIADALATEPSVLGVFLPGLSTDSQVCFLFAFGFEVTFPANATGSQAIAKTAATGSATYTFSKNGTPFATCVFDASAAGVFTMADAVTFNAGDILEIDGPADADATLANIGFTLVGTKG